MKTTIDLPIDLVREIKIRAVNGGRNLKEVVTDLLRSGLGQGVSLPPLPLKREKLCFLSFRALPPHRRREWRLTHSLRLSRHPNGMQIMAGVVSLFDTEAWVSLAFSSHPFHSKARAVFNGLIIQAGGVLQGTQTSFLRLLTTPVIRSAYGCIPITNHEAKAKCEELLKLPQVAWLDEPIGIKSKWSDCAVMDSPSPKT